MNPAVTVSPLTREMIPAVAEIERLCFAEPWSEHALELYLGNGAFAMAALAESGTAVGYGGILLAPDEGQILNLAVRPEARRQGAGSAILSALLDEARKRELESVSLEVRVSNQAAIALYKRFGFAVAGTRKRFYRRPAEDALVMVCKLPAALNT